MMTVIQAIILGIVQGLTEFMPISSTAHLIIIPWLFDWNEPSLAFDMALHMGTLLAVIWFFASDWKRLIKAGIASLIERKINGDPYRRLAWLFVAACIPGGIAGVIGESKIESLFHEPNAPISNQAMIAMAIIIVLLGIALFAAEKLARHRKNLERLTLKDTIIIGLSQALSIFPGVSRSGSTITGGLAIGLKREEAARFSFLLAAPLVAGAGLLSVIDVLGGLSSGTIQGSDLWLFAIGFIVAAAIGYLCIKLLLRFLQKYSTHIFVYYRWALAVFIVFIVFMRNGFSI